MGSKIHYQHTLSKEKILKLEFLIILMNEAESRDMIERASGGLRFEYRYQSMCKYLKNYNDLQRE